MTNYIICAHKTSLTSPLLLKRLYQARKLSGHVFICMLWLSTLSLSMIFLLEFGPVQTEWYFLFFVLLIVSIEYIFVLLHYSYYHVHYVPTKTAKMSTSVY